MPFISRRVLFPILLQASVAFAGCPGIPACSGRGVCRIQTCECFHGFQGGACEERSCPFGTAWADVVEGTDNGHNLAECSAGGKCDRSSGKCQCADIYDGLACERLKCQSMCSNHGKCVSMYEYNHFLNDEYEYTDIRWDADKITGCVCDHGWGGSDCSLRECPHGDDPMTPNQVNEEQRFQCLDDDINGTSAVKSFHLKWRGAFSPTIYSSDSLNTLVTKLRSMRSVYGSDSRNSYSGISATFSNNAYDRVCSPGYQTISLTFTQDFGDLPPMSVKAGANSPSFGEVIGTAQLLTESVKGTRENKECAGRGLCDTSTGTCLCQAGFQSGNGALPAGPGIRGDCSYNAIAAASCGGEIACSGHGTCTNTPQFVCLCSMGWRGSDCSERTCPEGTTFFDLATADNKAHAVSECSGNGLCERFSGTCICKVGFTGDACDRVDCANDGTKHCNGHGECFSMRQLATRHAVVNSYTYGENLFNLENTWDADSMHNCLCDEGYTGYDCSQKLCPVGKDPTPLVQPVYEVQQIRCSRTDSGVSSGWGLYLSFKRQKTSLIPVTASADTVKQALEALSAVDAGGITVTYTDGYTEFCNTTENVVTVAWTRNGGDLPLLQHVDLQHGSEITVNVTESVKGTHTMAPCSNKGTCDVSTGLCQCYKGWGSSDGMHAVGARGDCGYQLPIVMSS